MKLHAALLAAGLAALLGGCMDVDLDPFGGGDDSSDVAVQPNGCTPQGCPQAGQFCTARGYQAGTDGYNRCLISVEQNLRKGVRPGYPP